MSQIHRSAEQGYSIGAKTYVRGRPDYPQEITGWLSTTLDIGPGNQVLDLGSGTGKFLPYLKATGATVTALEPVEAMRDELAARHPDIRVLAGSAEAIPLPDESLDAVVCAQSFHWFANERALSEIWRVLKPGKALGLIWNVRDEDVDWVAALSRIIADYQGDTPRHQSGQWRALFPAKGFSPLQEQTFAHEHIGTADDVILGRNLSVSFIAALPPAEQQIVEGRIRALIANTPGLSGKETVSFPYKTKAFECRKI